MVGIDLGKKLGSGTFANVYEGTMDGALVACKIISTTERDARREYELHRAFYEKDNDRVVKPIAYCPLFDGESNMIVMERFHKSLFDTVEGGELKGDKIRVVVDTAIDNLRFFNNMGMYHRDCHLNNITSDGRLFDFGMAFASGMPSPTKFYETDDYDKNADVNMLMWSLYIHFPKMRSTLLKEVREHVENRLVVAIKNVEPSKLVCGTEVKLDDGTHADYVCSTKTMHRVQLRSGKQINRKRIGVVFNLHVMHYMTPHKLPAWNGTLLKNKVVTPPPVVKKRGRENDILVNVPLKKRQSLLS